MIGRRGARRCGSRVRLNAVSLVQAGREALLALREAVDTALAALDVVDAAARATAADTALTEPDMPATLVRPTKVKPPRVMSADHMHALNEGRRKARHKKDTAAGFAREMPDSSPYTFPYS